MNNCWTSDNSSAVDLAISTQQTDPNAHKDRPSIHENTVTQLSVVNDQTKTHYFDSNIME